MPYRAALFGLLSFFCLNPTVSVQAQTVTASPDSVVVASPATVALSVADPPKDKKGLSKPQRAALYSAILPGAGQFYNKDYWKVPVVYAVAGTLGYFIIDNNNRYNEYQSAYENSLDNNPTTLSQVKNSDGDWVTVTSATARNGRDFYRRNRDLTIILSVIAYGLNIMEANVGAHLNEFDVSDDLSLNVQPNLHFVRSGLVPAPGLSLNFRMKR